MPNEPALPVPGPITFDRIELAIIIALIAVFVGLFIWLTVIPGQQIYQYYVFALLSTLVLSGILKAVGAYKGSGVALSGSIVIFGVFFYLTKNSFESHDQLKADLIAKQTDLDTRSMKLTQITSEMDGLRVQLKTIFDRGIVIYTFRAGGNAPADQSDVFVQYFNKNAQPRTAEKDGSKHTIKWTDFNPALGIQFIADQSALPIQRFDRPRPNVKIDRISYSLENLGRVDRFDPVALELQTYLQTSE
jgi:hypothetical protein